MILILSRTTVRSNVMLSDASFPTPPPPPLPLMRTLSLFLSIGRKERQYEIQGRQQQGCRRRVAGHHLCRPTHTRSGSEWILRRADAGGGARDAPAPQKGCRYSYPGRHGGLVHRPVGRFVKSDVEMRSEEDVLFFMGVRIGYKKIQASIVLFVFSQRLCCGQDPTKPSAFLRQNSRKSAKSTPVRRTFSHSPTRLRRKP
jgi:hypothetical protein